MNVHGYKPGLSMCPIQTSWNRHDREQAARDARAEAIEDELTGLLIGDDEAADDARIYLCEHVTGAHGGSEFAELLKAICHLPEVEVTPKDLLAIGTELVQLVQYKINSAEFRAQVLPMAEKAYQERLKGDVA